MATDPTIRAQTYQYFLQEAPELLQTLEQGLLNLQEDCTINQINDLMRATHTLKGAAKSVELNTIANVAHSLEDIFRALCKPDVLINSEIEALLFEGFECLRLPLTAELTGRMVDHDEVLDRTATVFAQIQERLGDFFDQAAPLPSSAELGFDITQSIFETGVEKRLNQLAEALDNSPSSDIATLLRAQTDVFLGLAESLNLPGFGAIAEATIAALENHPPDQISTIARVALRDFQEGQAAVMKGDRIQGGHPSEELQRLASEASEAVETPEVMEESETNSHGALEDMQDFETPDLFTDLLPDFNEAIESHEAIADATPDLVESQQPNSSNQLLERIWGEQAISSQTTGNQASVKKRLPVEPTPPDQGNPNWFNKVSRWINRSSPSGPTVRAPSSPSPPEPVRPSSLADSGFSPAQRLGSAPNSSISSETAAVSSTIHHSSTGPSKTSPANPRSDGPDVFSPIPINKSSTRESSESAHDAAPPEESGLFSPIPINKRTTEKPAESPLGTAPPAEPGLFSPVPINKNATEKRSRSASSMPLSGEPFSLSPAPVNRSPAEERSTPTTPLPEEPFSLSPAPVNRSPAEERSTPTTPLPEEPIPVSPIPVNRSLAEKRSAPTTLPLEDSVSLYPEPVNDISSEPSADAAAQPSGDTVSLSPKPVNKISPVEPPIDASATPLAGEMIALAPHIRISIKHLDQLNYSVGELLTSQNRQSLQTEQLQVNVRVFLTRLKQHRQLLNQLWETQSSPTKPQKIQQPRKYKSRKHTLPKGNANLIQSLLDNTVQLTEAAEAVELFTRQSGQMIEQQRQLLSNSRDALIEARMRPLSEIFGRFPRVLQQLQTLHNKRIALKVRGTEVLVDKVVAEKLFDPLLHLVRNAFDHGIEPIEVRQKLGKPEKGQIELCAYNQGRYLVIEVRDDGKGLDFERIRRRAIENQRISPENSLYLNQSQLIDILFEPGFSTASHVSDLSGRGIGLDVVRNQLDALKGAVKVQSAPNQGTTFTLRIPLSLSIAHLLVCEASSKTYALLDSAVEQVLVPQVSQIQERNNCKVLRWSQERDEKLIPIYSLAEILDYGATVFHSLALATQPFADPKKNLKPVILIRHQDDLLGLEVDQLIGEQELVIRPLGSMITSPQYVHGASILADGKLALVIEGSILAQSVLEQQKDYVLDKSWATPSSPKLPLSLEQKSLPQAGLPASPLLAPETKANARILVVEDSITTRQSLVLTLQKAGYQVFQAEDGQEGIEQLQHQVGIQLVICDVEMPRMNGFEFLRRCQQLPMLANIPVITLTSRRSDQFRLLASQLGAAAYVTKPYMEHKLLVMVADLLEKKMVNGVSE